MSAAKSDDAEGAGLLALDLDAGRQRDDVGERQQRRRAIGRDDERRGRSPGASGSSCARTAALRSSARA